jgi:hypothetical protein
VAVLEVKVTRLENKRATVGLTKKEADDLVQLKPQLEEAKKKKSSDSQRSGK